jgi:ABC-type uncharacterized transport system substrate-binding protein
MKKQKSHFLITSVITLFFMVLPAVSQAAPKKVLAVFSYAEEFAWVQQIKGGIDSILAESCEIRYFYMNTKKDLQGGPQKALEAFALYKEFQPDGVITVDDNAQSMFVVPFLKDKVKTPVMFCGVNVAPEKYGFPASNVSGALERILTAQTIVLAKKLVPSAKTIACLAKDGPAARAIFKQIKNETDTYSARVVAFEIVKTKKEAVAAALELKNKADLLYVVASKGIKNESGAALTTPEIISMLAKSFGKPIISPIAINIKSGALCGAVLSASDQGATAAKMLLQAMGGTPVAQLPIVKETLGWQMINIDTLKALKLRPDPSAMRTSELVRIDKTTD